MNGAPNRQIADRLFLLAILPLGWLACIVACENPTPIGSVHAAKPLLDTAETYSGDEPILPIVADSSLESSKVALGKLLFHDRRLSKDNSISCADCHQIANGGADGKIKAVGYKKQVGPLNTPTVLNSSLNIAQFWDGRVKTLEEQIPGPVHNPIEMATDWKQVVAKLNQDAGLKQKFKSAYASNISSELIVDAIATYERALVTENSLFDQYLMGDESAISDAAKEGYRLFKEIGCVSCHQGRSVGGNMFQTFGIMSDYFEDKVVRESDKGRINVTHRQRDLHRFKVPSLRTASVTAPYFHDGNTATLEEAVAEMAKIQLGTELLDNEIFQVVKFIESLNGELAEGLE